MFTKLSAIAKSWALWVYAELFTEPVEYQLPKPANDNRPYLTEGSIKGNIKPFIHKSKPLDPPPKPAPLPNIIYLRKV